jgi:hypothetical protein
MDKKLFFDLVFESDIAKQVSFADASAFYNLMGWKEVVLLKQDFDKIQISSKTELMNYANHLDIIFQIDFENGIGESFHFQFARNKKTARIYASLFTNSVALPVLLEYINRYQVKYLTINNQADWTTQNASKIQTWKHLELSVPDYARLVPAFSFDDPKYKEIDKESLPGHIHGMVYADKLLFGAFWKMYFSEIYYKYIPKKIFDDFKDCEENIVLANGLRRITLYKDPNDF